MEGKLNNGSSLEPEKSSFDAKELSEKKPLVSSALIRTMAKDIAKLREIEVEEERKKIASMRPEEAKKEAERRKKDEKEKQEREKKEQEKKEKELILMKKKAEEEAKKIAAEEKRKKEQEEKEFLLKKKIEKKTEEERTKKMAEEEKIRKEKEEKEMLFQKFKEEELAKMRAEEEVKKMAEEMKRKKEEEEKEMLLKKAKEDEEKKRAEEEGQKLAEEARKKAEEARRIAEETRRKAEEVQRIEKEIQRKKEEEAQIMAKEIQKKKEEEERILLLQKIRENEEKKKLEEMKPKEPVYTQEEKTEQELILEKRKEELEKLIAEERTKKEIAKQQQNQKLKELLNKVKLPLEKLKARTAQPKMTEMPIVKRQGGGFFRRMPTERTAEIPVQEVGKTPEQELIEKLQRIESQREKERLEREEFLKRVATGKFETKPATFQPETTRFPLMSKLPVKKTPLSDKLFIRIIVVGFLVAAWATLFTFWYWFTIGRKPQAVETTPTPTPVETQEPIASASLLPVSSIKTIEFITQKELQDGLYTILHNEYPENQIQRILFKNTTEKKFLNLFEFFTALGIDYPVALKQKLDPDFTFFFYSAGGYNRFGLITKIKDRENLDTSLRNWETTIEENFDNLFVLIDKDKPAIIPYFRGAQHSGVAFRFQTFSRNDIGACYLIFGDYFAFTSSWDSMTKLIDLLK